MKDDDLDLIGCFGILALVVLAIPYVAVINGFTFSVLWSWFIVPIFDLPNLTIAQAIGLGLLVSALKSPKKQENSDKSALEQVLFLILYPLLEMILYLGLGWIVLQFI